MAQVFKNANRLAAIVAGEMREMDDAAARVKQEIVDQARPHRKSGDFIASIDIDTVKMDRVIYSDDPGAFAIEFGYDSPTGDRVEGQENFTKAVKKWR